ncbi:MAG: YgfZ/GcvT domain-containing protein, partial [Steroidobacteraceae bacterium]
MSTPWTYLSLAHLGALRVRGRDVVSFLQGQLSSDVAQLHEARALLAGYHNPQGRVIALLQLLQLAPAEVLAILPRELLQPVASRLSRFILRSKVQLADESAAWRIDALIAPAAAQAPTAGGAHARAAPSFADLLPDAPQGVARIDQCLAVRSGAQPARWLLICPLEPAAAAGSHPALAQCAPAAPDLWRRLAVESGEPQVYAATSEEFVAQMLNLDVLGAIAFDKGCYTGQEVIARAHYRGRVKRRLQRFRSRAPLELRAGDTGEFTDGRAFRVVEAVRLEDGACEFLAVAPLAAAETVAS